MRAHILTIVLIVLTLTAARADWEYIPDQIYCELLPGHTIEEINSRWGTYTLYADPAANLYLLGVCDISKLFEFIEAMNGDPAIEIASPNWLLQTPEAVRMMVIAAVGGTWADFQDQALAERIGVEAAHWVSTGAGVTVAVLDTGVDPFHEAFVGHLSEEMYDCIDLDEEPWEEANGLDDDGDELIDEGYGHGSMVAALVTLVAPNAQIMPIRVLDDEGHGTLFGICMGIMYAADHGANIINASFGAPMPLVPIETKLREAHQQGVFSFAGAGNRNLEEPPYHPAAASITYMVTALDSCDVKAYFSDYHTNVTVSAPGVGVRSAYPGNDWALGSGCSFATPLVAGEAALILSSMPTTTHERMNSLILGAVNPIYNIPGNQFYVGKLGTGRIYLPLALRTADVVPGDGSSSLSQIWPNPARGPIHFQVPGNAREGQLLIFDSNGRMLETLYPTATGSAVWSARTAGGQLVPSGIYFARISVGGRTEVAPLTIIR